jgi:hypothetical protein
VEVWQRQRRIHHFVPVVQNVPIVQVVSGLGSIARLLDPQVVQIADVWQEAEGNSGL